MYNCETGQWYWIHWGKYTTEKDHDADEKFISPYTMAIGSGYNLMNEVNAVLLE